MFACTSGVGDSGLARDRKLVDLDEDERRALCEYASALQGGPRMVSCDGGRIVEVPFVEDCAQRIAGYDACNATVDDAESCFDAIGDDVCGRPPSACLPIALCER